VRGAGGRAAGVAGRCVAGGVPKAGGRWLGETLAIWGVATRGVVAATATRTGAGGRAATGTGTGTGVGVRLATARGWLG
jgi:hypothetical protein